MGHIVLLGDSIFDNGRYTSGGLAVIDQVMQYLQAGWAATLLAVDGSTTEHVAAQVEHLPKSASQVSTERGRK